MFEGQMKAVTFSYDDGVSQDHRLVRMFNRYGLKATFNVNSGLLGHNGRLIVNEISIPHVKVRPEEVAALYRGHEVAAHTLTHPPLCKQTDEEVLRQVQEDRRALSELVGYEVVGMAYPGGGQNHDDRVVELLGTTDLAYARTIISNYSFEPQTDLLRFRPTIHHVQWDKLFELAEQFLALQPETPQIFYIWGHSYEFDIDDSWEQMERFCRLIAGHDDIFYGTNREVLLGK